MPQDMLISVPKSPTHALQRAGRGRSFVSLQPATLITRDQTNSNAVDDERVDETLEPADDHHAPPSFRGFLIPLSGSGRCCRGPPGRLQAR